jgi:hypothetical protein
MYRICIYEEGTVHYKELIRNPTMGGTHDVNFYRTFTINLGQSNIPRMLKLEGNPPLGNDSNCGKSNNERE